MKNAIKQRLPKSAENLKKLESDFIGSVEKTSLQDLSLDELANRFEDIEQQGQLLQGQILLEARNRLGSDKEFGKWCATHSICVGSQQQRNRLIHLARFFETRELDKISISAAYEISAPINADVAVEIYEIARGKNMPVAEVKRQIALKKGISGTSVVPTSAEATQQKQVVETATELLPVEINQSQTVTSSFEKSKIEIILTEVLADMTEGEKANILRECLRNIRLYPSK